MGLQCPFPEASWGTRVSLAEASVSEGRLNSEQKPGGHCLPKSTDIRQLRTNIKQRCFQGESQGR